MRKKRLSTEQLMLRKIDESNLYKFRIKTKIFYSWGICCAYQNFKKTKYYYNNLVINHHITSQWIVAKFTLFFRKFINLKKYIRGIHS